jgi:hypothetical protein
LKAKSSEIGHTKTALEAKAAIFFMFFCLKWLKDQVKILKIAF